MAMIVSSSPTARRAIMLRRHPLALISALLRVGGLGGAAAGVAATFDQPFVVFAVVLLVLVHGAGHVAHWATFRVILHTDRITVRSLGFGITQISYPLVALRGITYRQHPLAQLCDMGTLILTLPEATRHFRWLTPYAQLRALLDG